MAAPKGNTNAVGHKGAGGRRPLKVEQKELEELAVLATTPFTNEEIVEMMKKKRTLLDIWKAKAFSGNERFLSDMFKKLFPDTVKVTGNLNQKGIKALEGDVREILSAIGGGKIGGEKKKIVVKKK